VLRLPLDDIDGIDELDALVCLAPGREKLAGGVGDGYSCPLPDTMAMESGRTPSIGPTFGRVGNVGGD
jgi:hypothetical protein